MTSLTGIPRVAQGYRRQSSEQKSAALVHENGRSTEFFGLGALLFYNKVKPPFFPETHGKFFGFFPASREVIHTRRAFDGAALVLV